jgi:perosamine synthetase
MYARKRLDIGWSDLWSGLWGGLRGPVEAQERALEELWSPEEAVVCLSVRSGFHLMLSALRLPRGSEVLVSSVTIPHMVQILEHHGLVPVPVPLDPATMAPELSRLEALISPRTRAVLVAHLYGGLVELGPLARLARGRGLLLWEDCAQAFAGEGFRGSLGVDAVMFSFGTIKTATALGGGLLRVRDAALRAEMLAIQAGWPRQEGGAWARKVLRGAALRALSAPALMGAAAAAVEASGRRWDEVIMAASRGFPGGDLLGQISRRPSAGLVSLLRRRVADTGPNHLDARREGAQWLVERLPAGSVLGERARRPTWWLLPVLAREPAALVARLRALGFDATTGGTSLAVVPAVGRGGDARMARLMAQVVYVPDPGAMPPAARAALLEALRGALLEGYDSPQEVACA